MIDVLILCLPIIAVVLVAVFSKKTEVRTETKLDKIGKVTNIVLSFPYVFISLLGVLLLMSGDGLTNEENQIKIVLTYIIMYMGLLTPAISILSIFLSAFFRSRGKSILSFCIQFLAVIWFAIIMIVSVIEGKL